MIGICCGDFTVGPRRCGLASALRAIAGPQGHACCSPSHSLHYRGTEGSNPSSSSGESSTNCSGGSKHRPAATREMIERRHAMDEQERRFTRKSQVTKTRWRRRLTTVCCAGSVIGGKTWVAGRRRP